MQFYWSLSTIGGSELPLYGILIDALVLMNPPVGVVLMGAVQLTWIMFLLISFGQQQCRRTQTCHGMFAWFVK